MPRLRALRNISGRMAGQKGRIERGEVFEADEEAAEAIVAAGYAEEAEEEPQEPEAAPEEEPQEEAEAETEDAWEGAEPFASGAAAELAVSEGLSAEDFEGVEASGKTGYTKADVEAVVAEQEG